MLYFKTDMKNKMKNSKIKTNLFIYVVENNIKFWWNLIKICNFFLFFNLNLRKLGFNIELGPI